MVVPSVTPQKGRSQNTPSTRTVSLEMDVSCACAAQAIIPTCHAGFHGLASYQSLRGAVKSVSWGAVNTWEDLVEQIATCKPGKSSLAFSFGLSTVTDHR